MEIAIGNFLLLNGTQYKFQNFFINETITYSGNDYTFAPFGFSGVSVNRNGDGTECSIVFPNNSLTRNWADEAIKNKWLCNIKVMILDPTDNTSFNPMHTYHGRITGGQWNEISVTLSVGTILDSVGSDVPQRRLDKSLVGDLPTSSGVRLQ